MLLKEEQTLNIRGLSSAFDPRLPIREVDIVVHVSLR
jgi:hypothetical protein